MSKPTTIKPTIVCLCGSTRFGEAFEKANLEETLAGRIVLTVGCYRSDFELNFDSDVKYKLDVLHLQKIEMADELKCWWLYWRINTTGT